METNKPTQKNKSLVYLTAALAAVLVILLVFFLIERSKNVTHIKAIEQEKTALTQELKTLSTNYDGLKTTNTKLNDQLTSEQAKIASLMDEMTTYKNSTYAEISRYKREISNLKATMRSYVIQIDSLNQLNQMLTAENTEVKQQAEWLRERNTKLEDDQKTMQEILDRAGALNAFSFHLTPINKKDKATRWKKCVQLRGDFVLEKNAVAERGTRTIYMRVTRPDGEIIAFDENSTFQFQGTELAYTAKREIEFEGTSIEVAIYWPNDGSLTKGTYTAELFSDNHSIGRTTAVFK